MYFLEVEEEEENTVEFELKKRKTRRRKEDLDNRFSLYFLYSYFTKKRV